MTDRDFDTDDRRVLAEFCGYEYFIDADEKVVVNRDGSPRVFEPWNEYSEQWQIQSCLYAVREKGLIGEWARNLCEIIDLSYQTEDGGVTYQIASAPPEAICKSILEMEG